jgi:hypothetical protein
MDENVVFILEKVGIFLNEDGTIPEILIPRDVFLDAILYDELKEKIDSLKKVFSSTHLTSLHKEAVNKQQFPLLNLVRQILLVYKHKMVPIRKCDGYTVDGTKMFKRYFFIERMTCLQE